MWGHLKKGKFTHVLELIKTKPERQKPKSGGRQQNT